MIATFAAEVYVALTLVGRPPPSASWQSTPPSSTPPNYAQAGGRSSVVATPPASRPVKSSVEAVKPFGEVALIVEAGGCGDQRVLWFVSVIAVHGPK